MTSVELINALKHVADDHRVGLPPLAVKNEGLPSASPCKK